jgi:hypothetical protein
VSTLAVTVAVVRVTVVLLGTGYVTSAGTGLGSEGSDGAGAAGTHGEGIPVSASAFVASIAQARSGAATAAMV